MSVPSGLVTINGLDVSELGLGVLDLNDWWSIASVERTFVQPYGVFGTIPGPVGVNPRTIPLRFIMPVTDIMDRVSTIDEVIRNTRGLLEVCVLDDPTRVAYGYMQRVRAMPEDRREAWIVGDLAIDAEIVCYDPVKYSLNPKTISLSSTLKSLGLEGTAPASGQIEIHGTATTPVIEVRSLDGVLLGTMTLTTLGADDAYVIDLSGMIVYYNNGVESNGFERITAGWWFELDPQDQPLVSVSSGNAHAVLRERWL